MKWHVSRTHVHISALHCGVKRHLVLSVLHAQHLLPLVPCLLSCKHIPNTKVAFYKQHRERWVSFHAHKEIQIYPGKISSSLINRLTIQQFLVSFTSPASVIPLKRTFESFITVKKEPLWNSRKESTTKFRKCQRGFSKTEYSLSINILKLALFLKWTQNHNAHDVKISAFTYHAEASPPSS